MNHIVVLIMAAGSASRFGSPKQLACWQGKSLLAHAIENAANVKHLMESAVDDEVTVHCRVVLGAYAEQIEEHIGQHDNWLSVIRVRNWQSGLGRSIAEAVKQLNKDVDAVLILLADQPRVSAGTLQNIVESYMETQTAPALDSAIACVYPNGSPGVPALFPKSHFHQLKRLTGDLGAKPLLGEAKLVELAMQDALLDVDTREDLLRLDQPT